MLPLINLPYVACVHLFVPILLVVDIFCSHINVLNKYSSCPLFLSVFSLEVQNDGDTECKLNNMLHFFTYNIQKILYSWARPEGTTEWYELWYHYFLMCLLYIYLYIYIFTLFMFMLGQHVSHVLKASLT